MLPLTRFRFALVLAVLAWLLPAQATRGEELKGLKLDGEKVLGTECIIGYLHRGVEKIAENRTYAQFNPYVDRMDYVAAISNGLGYCLAVEKMLNVEAPPRAQVVRVILTELNRIASHLLWLGTHALDIGAITPFIGLLGTVLGISIAEAAEGFVGRSVSVGDHDGGELIVRDARVPRHR